MPRCAYATFLDSMRGVSIDARFSFCTLKPWNAAVLGRLQFVGYKQPYSRIRYELDFSPGAEVDLGCGTAVIGNGEFDSNIPKDVFTHPLSMHHNSYQWVSGRSNLKADPPDPGYFPHRCPRYHRFKVTQPGNFTFVRHTAWQAVRVCTLKRPFPLWH